MYYSLENKNSLYGVLDFVNHGFPGGFPNFQQPQEEVVVHTLEAIDAHTVRLAFMIPQIIVGLHGRVEVRYTYEK